MFKCPHFAVKFFSLFLYIDMYHTAILMATNQAEDPQLEQKKKPVTINKLFHISVLVNMFLILLPVINGKFWYLASR